MCFYSPVQHKIFAHPLSALQQVLLPTLSTLGNITEDETSCNNYLARVSVSFLPSSHKKILFRVYEILC